MISVRKSLVSVEFDIRFRDRPAKIIGGTEGDGSPFLPERILFTDREGGETDCNSVTAAEWVDIAGVLRQFSRIAPDYY